jgi:hypothetical protein
MLCIGFLPSWDWVGYGWRVVELFACWRGQFKSHFIIEVWKLITQCLMWCIWRECNAWNFEDCKSTVTKLKTIVFKTLFIWMDAYNCSCFSNFLFLDLCFSSTYWFFYLVYFPCTWVAPFCTFLWNEFLIKKIIDYLGWKSFLEALCCVSVLPLHAYLLLFCPSFRLTMPWQ